MAFVPAPDTAKIVAHYDQTGIPAVNIFYVLIPGDFDETLANDLADVFRTDWQAQMMSHLASGLILTDIEIRDASTVDGAVFHIDTSLPITGAVGQEFANNVAATITLQTGFAGRSQRGRIFLPGVPVGAYQKDVFLTAATANFQTSADSLLDAFTTGGYSWVVASFVHLGAPRVTAQLLPVISVRANQQVHTMKRRLT